MNADAYRRPNKDKLQEYGKEGLAPILDLFKKYGGEIEKYIGHVQTGLNQGCQNLRSDSSSNPEKEMVATWFEQGATWVDKLKAEIQEQDTDKLLKFIETQGREHPAALFATTLIAGSVFGVVGKKAYNARSQNLNQDHNPNASL